MGTHGWSRRDGRELQTWETLEAAEAKQPDLLVEQACDNLLEMEQLTTGWNPDGRR